MKISHESYIHRVRDIVSTRVSGDVRDKILNAKLVYGCGSVPGARGVTYFGRWKNGHEEPIDIAEVCAFGEENPVQIAGTTIHELAHIVAGLKAGHGKEWKDACKVLGLRRAHAAGQYYLPAAFDHDFRMQWAIMPHPEDGKPHGSHVGPGIAIRPRPCSAGIGTRGGKSRGVGSGSRLRKWNCPCGIIVRVSSDDFKARCLRCDGEFYRG